MSKLKIKSAIIYFNDNVREPEEPKMSQKSLALEVMPEEKEETANNYMTQFANGNKTIKPDHIIRICLNTGVDPNFLYDWEVIKNNEKLLSNGEK